MLFLMCVWGSQAGVDPAHGLTPCAMYVTAMVHRPQEDMYALVTDGCTCDAWRNFSWSETS